MIFMMQCKGWCKKMTDKSTSDTTSVAVKVLQYAINEEVERKAKLGQDAVVCDQNGVPQVVPASLLIKRKSRVTKKQSR